MKKKNRTWKYDEEVLPANACIFNEFNFIIIIVYISQSGYANAS